jgi:DNA-binding transcriptional MerR regulator
MASDSGNADVRDVAETADERRMTVDELAAAAGLPSRTVRHYQSEKVLQPPERQGRVAYYGAEHLRRLQLIATLQDRGLRLSAIRDALARVEKGELWLDDWLGLGEELRAPWLEEGPVVMTARELADRVDHRPGLVTLLVEAGVVQRQGGLQPSYLVRSPGLLDITLELDASGVDVETAAAAAVIMRKQIRRAAEELVEHFLQRSGEGFARTGSTKDVAEALGALRPLGLKAVQLMFGQEIERALGHAVDKGRASRPPVRADRPAKAGPLHDADRSPDHPL